MSGEMPDTLYVLPFVANQTEAQMRETARAYNNSRDSIFRNAYYKKYKGLAEENIWD